MKEEEIEEPPSRRSSKRRIHVSLFKKRKKAKIRSIVVTKRSAREKFLFQIILLCIIVIFLCVGVLFGVQKILNLSVFQGNDKPIIVPVLNDVVTSEDVARAFDKTHLNVEKIANASNSAIFEVKIEDGPTVILSGLRNVTDDVVLVDSILRRLTIENKKPIIIDLRYNKPIVKF